MDIGVRGIGSEVRDLSGVNMHIAFTFLYDQGSGICDHRRIDFELFSFFPEKKKADWQWVERQKRKIIFQNTVLEWLPVRKSLWKENGRNQPNQSGVGKRMSQNWAEYPKQDVFIFCEAKLQNPKRNKEPPKTTEQEWLRKIVGVSLKPRLPIVEGEGEEDAYENWDRKS